MAKADPLYLPESRDMPVKIRLMRIGAKKRPFYRVVAVDERKKRSGEYLDLLGTFNPLTNPKEIKLDQKKVDEWVKKGAVLSDGFLRMTGKAPQRPPRKAKKEKAEKPPEPAKTESAPASEVPTEEPVVKEQGVEEKPAEESKEEPKVEVEEPKPEVEEKKAE